MLLLNSAMTDAMKLDNFSGTLISKIYFSEEERNRNIVNFDNYVIIHLESFSTRNYRKIYGVEYKGEIHAVMCFAYTNKIPTSVDELEKLSTDAFLQSALRDQNIGQIAIAYTVWSKKKGGGKLIVKEVFKKIKKSNHLNRLITLSPLTDMATKFHSRNGAELIQIYSGLIYFV